MKDQNRVKGKKKHDVMSFRLIKVPNKAIQIWNTQAVLQ